MLRKTPTLAVTILLTFSAGIARGHALGADCRLTTTHVRVSLPWPITMSLAPTCLVPIAISDSHIVVDAFYSDSTPARRARVELLDTKGQLLQKANADDSGRCRFPAPGPGDYSVVVNAGAGHRVEQSVKIPTAKTQPTIGVVRVESDINVEGASRDRLTRFPWLNVVVGLSVIATVTLIVLLARRGDRSHAVSDPSAYGKKPAPK